MPLTLLDPVAALVVVDLQKGIVALPTAHPAADVVGRAARLAHAFRQRGLPVVLVNVAGGAPGRTDQGPRNFTPAADWAEFVSELGRQPGDLVVTKMRWGAFSGTSLDAQLKEKGVTQVFMVGIATSIGVESTARHAHELGYHVVLVTDAMTDLDPEMHSHAVAKVFPRLGETTTTDELLRVLAQPGLA